MYMLKTTILALVFMLSIAGVANARCVTYPRTYGGEQSGAWITQCDDGYGGSSSRYETRQRTYGGQPSGTYETYKHDDWH